MIHSIEENSLKLETLCRRPVQAMSRTNFMGAFALWSRVPSAAPKASYSTGSHRTEPTGHLQARDARAKPAERHHTRRAG